MFLDVSDIQPVSNEAHKFAKTGVLEQLQNSK